MATFTAPADGSTSLTLVDSLGTSWSLTAEQSAALIAKASEAEKILLSDTRDPLVNGDGNVWRLEFERKDLSLTVFNSDAKGSSIRRFKAVCLFEDTPPDALMKFICNTSHRLTWDRNIKLLTTLSLADDEVQGKVVVLRSGTKQVGPISGRDFIDVTIVRHLADGSIVNGGTGLDLRDTFGIHPVTSEFVRGLNQAGTGWHVEPINDGKGSKVNYVIQTDLKGWFTAFVINQAIGGSYVSFFDDCKKALREHKS